MRRALWMLLLATGCGDDSGGGGGTVNGTARLYNGATPTGMGFIAPLTPPPAPPENGQWLVSPDKLTMKLVTIGLSPGGGLVTVDCPVTYDQSQPGLTQLAECPFTVNPGTFDTLDVGFSTEAKVLIDDPDAGFFSTATGVSTTAPGGGAQELTYMIGGMAGETRLSPVKLAEPITVADGDVVSLSIVIDALQSMRLTVNGSSVTLGHSGSIYPNDPGRPDIVATAGQLAKIKTYTSAQVATSGSYCAGACTSSPPGGITAVSLFYTSMNAVSMVGLRLNGTPSSCAQMLYPAFVNVDKAYVGLDTSSVAGWAVFGDPSLTGYSAVFAMPQVAMIGSTTPLYCQNTTVDPAPSGGSFASAAPAIQMAGNSLGDYTLVAQ